MIHHSRWGMGQVRERYAFRPDAVHRVIPHGHFGNLHVTADRKEVERELGLTPGKLRLGIIGAPRPEKDVGMVIEAFAAALQPVYVWSAIADQTLALCEAVYASGR